MAVSPVAFSDKCLLEQRQHTLQSLKTKQEKYFFLLKYKTKTVSPPFSVLFFKDKFYTDYYAGNASGGIHFLIQI